MFNHFKQTLLVLSVSLTLVLYLSGCQQLPFVETDSSEIEESFSVDHVAKSDIDLILDHQVKTVRSLLKTLMLKLYQRNPAYWRNSSSASPEARVQELFDRYEYEIQAMLQNTSSIESIKLAFDPAFKGDRVLAYVYGLKSMMAASFSNKQSFYMLDQLDPQKLHDSARNVEVAVWMLSNKRMPNGDLYLVSNELHGPVKNLSFERLFGKLIMALDISSQIVADSSKRTVKNVIQGIARYVLIPI